jgi:hypothetical protein
MGIKECGGHSSQNGIHAQKRLNLTGSTIQELFNKAT